MTEQRKPFENQDPLTRKKLKRFNAQTYRDISVIGNALARMSLRDEMLLDEAGEPEKLRDLRRQLLAAIPEAAAKIKAFEEARAVAFPDTREALLEKDSLKPRKPRKPKTK